MFKQSLQQALDHLYAKRPQQAADIFDEHEGQLASDPEIAKAAGYAYEFSNQIAKAIPLYEASLAGNSNQPDLQHRIADIYSHLGRHDEAANFYRDLLVKDSHNLELGYKAGMAALNSGKPNIAKRIVERLLKLAPKNAKLHMLHGQTLLKLRLTEQAEFAIATAAQHGHDELGVAYRQAQLLSQKGQFEEAIELFQAALKLKESLPDSYLDQAVCALMLSDHARAMSIIGNGLAKFPENRELAIMQAELAHELGDDPQSTHLISTLSNGENSTLSLSALQHLESLGHHDQIDRYLENNPKIAQSPAITMIRIRRLINEKQFETALALTSALPNSVMKRRLEATSLMGIGRYTDAYNLLLPILESEQPDQLDMAILLTALRLIDENKFKQIVDIDRHVIRVKLDEQPQIDTLNKQLKHDLEALHFARQSPLSQSVNGGTQTPGDIFDHDIESINLLLAKLQHAVESHVGESVQASLAEDHPLKRNDQPFVSKGWSIRTHAQGNHIPHVHSKGWYSSAYYVSLPDEVKSGQGGELVLGEPGLYVPDHLEPLAVIQPEEGTLVLFPSYLWHGTKPFKSDESRLVVAFDVL